MKTGTVIIGIILFAIATMVIYIWGLMKQSRQSSDLMSMLFSKGNKKVIKYLKQNEYINVKDIENLAKDMQVKMPFSRNRAVVKDKRDFAKQLINYMLKTGQVEQEGNKYKLNVKN